VFSSRSRLPVFGLGPASVSLPTTRKAGLSTRADLALGKAGAFFTIGWLPDKHGLIFGWMKKQNFLSFIYRVGGNIKFYIDSLGYPRAIGCADGVRELFPVDALLVSSNP